MASMRFKNNLRFALRKEAPELRADIPINRLERIGNILAWFFYDFKRLVLELIYDPRFITVLLTAFAMVLSALLFYPSNTWSILWKVWKGVLHNVNWGYIRFGLWLISEVTILGLGMRAFGRFSNQRLMEYHKTTA